VPSLFSPFKLSSTHNRDETLSFLFFFFFLGRQRQLFFPPPFFSKGNAQRRSASPPHCFLGRGRALSFFFFPARKKARSFFLFFFFLFHFEVSFLSLQCNVKVKMTDLPFLFLLKMTSPPLPIGGRNLLLPLSPGREKKKETSSPSTPYEKKHSIYLW